MQPHKKGESKTDLKQGSHNDSIMQDVGKMMDFKYLSDSFLSVFIEFALKNALKWFLNLYEDFCVRCFDLETI